MIEKDKAILAAAQSVFARYGVNKATMNDIAREAGVARQTLYNKYPGKSEVLRACVHDYGQTSMDTVVAAWATEPSFAGKLEQFFAHCPLAWYDTIQAAPDAADLIDGINAVAAEEMTQMQARWEDLFTQEIKGSTGYTGDAEALAAFIYSTAINAKHNLPDRAALVSRLSVLRQAVMALITEETA